MPRRRRKRTRKAPRPRNKSEKCSTPWCRNRRVFKTTTRVLADGSVKTYESSLPWCWKCHSKRLRDRHPLTYVLNAIRNRARQRGIPFTITRAEFEKFCQETHYLEKRGHGAGWLSIDRKNHDQGYHIGNIQIMEFIENCTQGHVVPGKECKQNESAEYEDTDPVYAGAEEGQPF